MKKQIAVLTLAALMLSGCGSAPAPETTAAPTVSVMEPLVDNTPTDSAYPDHMLLDVDSMSYLGYHVSSEDWAGPDSFTLFTCRDQNGSTLWKQEAPHHNGGAQVAPTHPLGIENEAFFYFHDGVVTALDLTTGSPIWESPNTGICLASTEAAWVDPDGFICLSDYFGGNLAVLDFDGNLIREIPSQDPNLYWISSMTRQGDSIIIHLDGGSLESPSGTDLAVPIDWLP